MLTLHQAVDRDASFEGHRDSCRGAHCPLIGKLHSPHSGAAIQQHFMTASHNTHNVLVSGCTNCGIVNPTLQIRRIGNRSAVAL